MLLSPTVRQFEGEAHTNHLYNEHYILETLQIFRSKTFSGSSENVPIILLVQLKRERKKRYMRTQEQSQDLLKGFKDTTRNICNIGIYI